MHDRQSGCVHGFVQVKLHMVSTIALVISIGFAVDYSAHMCHCFTHCLGKTRNQRQVKTATVQQFSTLGLVRFDHNLMRS